MSVKTKIWKGRRKERVVDTPSFAREAQRLHNFTYDYSLVQYAGSQEKVRIVCAEHGVFMQRPAAHLQGHGCPTCAGKDAGRKKYGNHREIVTGQDIFTDYVVALTSLVEDAVSREDVDISATDLLREVVACLKASNP